MNIKDLPKEFVLMYNLADKATTKERDVRPPAGRYSHAITP